MSKVSKILMMAALAVSSFLLGHFLGRHTPITVEVINSKPNWWGYNHYTRHLTVGLGGNTNPANNATYTFKP